MYGILITKKYGQKHKHLYPDPFDTYQEASDHIDKIRSEYSTYKIVIITEE